MAGYYFWSSSFLLPGLLRQSETSPNKFNPWAMFTHQCSTVVFNGGAPRMCKAHMSGAPQPRKLGYLYI